MWQQYYMFKLLHASWQSRGQNEYVLQKLLGTRKYHKVVHCIWQKHRCHFAASDQPDWLFQPSVFMFLVERCRHLDFFNVSLKSSYAAVLWNVKFKHVNVSAHTLAAQRFRYSLLVDVHLLKMYATLYSNNFSTFLCAVTCSIDAQYRLLMKNQP